MTNKQQVTPQPTHTRPLARVWKPIFIETLRRTANVSQAARAADIDRAVAYRARTRSPTFAATWAEAIEEAVDTLHAIAWQRAADGWLEPVFQGGREVGVIRRFDNNLLTTLLKAHRPEMFRDNYRVEHAGLDQRTQPQINVIFEHDPDHTPDDEDDTIVDAELVDATEPLQLEAPP